MSTELKMPPDAVEAFRGLPEDYITAAVVLAQGLPKDAAVTVTAENRLGSRHVAFTFTHGGWTFSGFVRAKSGEHVEWGR